MIRLKDFLDSVEFQSDVKYFYYDYEKDERIELTEEEAGKYEIRYIYEEDRTICIEVDKSDS